MGLIQPRTRKSNFTNWLNFQISSYFDVQSNGLVCEAQRDFKAGEQVFIHYGNRSNLDLLLYSGFSLKSNPYDMIKIKMAAKVTPKHQELQIDS